jgi:hypothetical protein
MHYIPPPPNWKPDKEYRKQQAREYKLKLFMIAFVLASICFCMILICLKEWSII